MIFAGWGPCCEFLSVLQHWQKGHPPIKTYAIYPKGSYWKTRRKKVEGTV